MLHCPPHTSRGYNIKNYSNMLHIVYHLSIVNGNTPGPEFRENSHVTGARSLKNGSQRFDPPWGIPSMPGARGLCRGEVLPWGDEAVPERWLPGGTRGDFSPGKKLFSWQNNFPHAMYKEEREAGLRKLVDKAIFRAILWWV